MREFLAAIFIVLAAPAGADVPCMPRDAAMSELAARYSEAPLFDALVLNPRPPAGTLTVTITANASTGTWTMMVSSDEGATACIIMAGRGFTPAHVGKPL